MGTPLAPLSPMHFFMDRAFVREILGSDRLLPEDVRTIMRIVYITTHVDFDQDVAEREALQEIAGCLWDVAGVDAEAIQVVSPLPLDDYERRNVIRGLAAQLPTRGGREVAYVASYLAATADRELAPVEGKWLDEIQHALGIADERAADLAATGAESITPGLRDTAEEELHAH